jgi:NADPH2:quinone reductase
VRAVRFDDYGDSSVLRIEEVPDPVAERGQVVVQVKATGINPADAKIRGGIMRSYSPLAFPASQGSELAGVVTALGEGVTQFSIGDEVFGWSRDRLAQAQFAAVAAEDLLAKPASVAFEVAGALVAVGCTSWAAVSAIPPIPNETVVVSGAGGGIGSVVVQLMLLREAEVFGIAAERHHDRLRALGATPMLPGADVEARLRAGVPAGVNTFVDTVGDGYVQLALRLGVAAERVHTVIDFPAVEKYGVTGGAASASVDILAKLIGLLAAGSINLRVAATFPLEEVRAAYEHLASGHPGGKVVLIP